MTPSFSRSARLAADRYEALIEDAILHTEDLYALDGETFLRHRSGRIETGCAEALHPHRNGEP